MITRVKHINTARWRTIDMRMRMLINKDVNVLTLHIIQTLKYKINTV